MGTLETHSEFSVGMPDEEDFLRDVDICDNVTWKINL
jgi:hypothetical protein